MLKSTVDSYTIYVNVCRLYRRLYTVTLRFYKSISFRVFRFSQPLNDLIMAFTASNQSLSVPPVGVVPKTLADTMRSQISLDTLSSIVNQG